MPAPHAPSSTAELRAISENRKAVLDIAADLSDAISRHGDQLAIDEFDRRLTMLLVGAAFALWRAVPLVHNSMTPRNIVEASANYLDRIVRHNAINYGDDDKERVWAFGFYMGNARYRLSEACGEDFCREWPDGKARLDGCGLLAAATTPRQPGYDPAKKVREYIDALRALTDCYRERLAAKADWSHSQPSNV